MTFYGLRLAWPRLRIDFSHDAYDERRYDGRDYTSMGVRAPTLASLIWVPKKHFMNILDFCCCFAYFHHYRWEMY